MKIIVKLTIFFLCLLCLVSFHTIPANAAGPASGDESSGAPDPSPGDTVDPEDESPLNIFALVVCGGIGLLAGVLFLRQPNKKR